MDKIQTFGNRCFAGRPVIDNQSPPVKSPRQKAEKVNLKFGKIRVVVTNAKKVRVAQDGTAMIVILEELPSSAGHL